MFSPKFTLVIAASLSIASVASACDNCKSDMVFGRPVPMGMGMAWSWAQLDKDTKKPIAIGVSFTETALEGLATEIPADTNMRWMETVLEVPEVIKGQPWDHITMDWNPKGHIPPGIYDVPHFDFHFYTMSMAERTKITNKGDDVARCEKHPEDRFKPAGFILPPGTIEADMGAHWVDPTSPELNGKPFSSTFIYGTYDGHLTFWEPMASHAFLKSQPDFKKDLPVPSAFQKPGYYPSSYRVYYNPVRKEYSVSLEGLKHFEAAK